MRARKQTSRRSKRVEKRRKCLSLLNRHLSSCGDAQAALRGDRDRRQAAAVFQLAREGDDKVGSADASEKLYRRPRSCGATQGFDYLLTCARRTYSNRCGRCLALPQLRPDLFGRR
jgi:hypothetical protein